MSAKEKEEPGPSGPREELLMPLHGHLDDLRSAIFRILAVVGLGLLLTYTYVEPILAFLEAPLLKLLPEGKRFLYYTGLTEKFMTYLKVSVISSVCLVSPYILFEVWRFVAPGLYRNERRFLLPFLVFGSLAFWTGAAFAYWVVIPAGYGFLLEFGSSNEQALITLNDYFGLTLQLIFALGLVFEVPVAMVVLGSLGILRSSFLRNNRGYAFVICSVVAAVATPSPDALTMLFVLGPLYLLYEAGIFGVGVVEPKAEVADRKG